MENQVKYCFKCQEEIHPDFEGDYFCLDCNYAYLINPHPNMPINTWVKFKQ